MSPRRTFRVDVTVGRTLSLDIEAESAGTAKAIAEYLFEQPGYAAEYDPTIVETLIGIAVTLVDEEAES